MIQLAKSIRMGIWLFGTAVSAGMLWYWYRFSKSAELGAVEVGLWILLTTCLWEFIEELWSGCPRQRRA